MIPSIPAFVYPSWKHPFSLILAGEGPLFAEMAEHARSTLGEEGEMVDIIAKKPRLILSQEELERESSQ